MKFRVFLAVAAALFCQALFARSLAPLEKSQTGERTNHPVLFVSGLGSNASGTWGAKGKELYCETPELLMDVAPKVVSYEWINEFRGVTAGLNPHKKYIGKFIPTVAYPYRCSNMIDTLYSGEIVLEPLDIRYNRKISQDTLNHSRPQPYVLGEVTRAKNEDITLPYGAHRVKSYSEKFDFGKFWLIVGGEKLSADRILPDMSYEGMKNFLKPFMDADDISDVYVCFMNCITSKPQLTKKAYIALLKRTGINLMADSLLARSRAIMAERENSMAAQHPDGDREQTFDFPTSYKSNGIPYAIAHTLKIPAQNMNANFAKTTNGLYFFNAKTRCHASSHANVGADCDALEEWANPRWDTTFENYGQPNQLLDKMVRSLDDFYGKDAWHDDTNAVIDIVAHSQGGLITRIAIDKSRSPNGRNPVNHINRVITINTPHNGSALATSANRLTSGYSYDPYLGDYMYHGDAYPQLAELKEWLFSKDASISLKGSMTLVLADWINAVKIGVLPFISPLLPFATTNAKASFNFSGAPLGPYEFNLGVNVNVASVLSVEAMRMDTTFTLGDIGALALKAEHLAWPGESDYMRELCNMRYPTYPSNGDFIHVTHFYGKGLSRNFLEIFGQHLLAWTKNQCTEKIQESGYASFVDKEASCNKLLTKILQGSFGNSWNELQDRFKRLDADWPWRSDLVVETSSQKGIYPEVKYHVYAQDIPAFRAKEFRWNPNTVIHGALPDGVSSIVKEMGLAAATQQSCDVLSELGVSTTSFEHKCNLSTSLNRLLKARLDSLTSRMLFRSLGKSAKSSISSFDYYFVAEPGKALDVQTSGADASVKVEHVGGAIHKATIRPAAPAEGDWPANGEFSLSIQYADGTPRDASNDPSRPVVDGIALSIPVYDETERRVGGLIPSLDTSAQGVADLYEVRVEAKERSRAGNVSQPSVRVTNVGDLALPGFRLRYTFKTAKKPELRVYWIDRMRNATWSLVDLGENLHAVEFVYSDIDLKKGESVSPVDFELFHADWSPWNRADDHSALGVGEEWALAPFVELFTLDGGRLWGISPDMIPRDSTEGEAPRTSLKVVGREESDLYNKSTHRLRVVNDGDVPVEGFVVYDYFTSEGQEPLFDAWDVPRCAVSKEHLGGLEWRLVYDCSNVVLDPGQEADWAEWGMLVDRHYPDWSAWDASNDWSALTSEWAEATRVRVVAKDGTPLWGEAPALAAPANASFAMGLPGPLGPEFLPPL